MEDTLVYTACWDCLYICKSWDAAARRWIELECRENPMQEWYWPLYWAAGRGFKKLVRLCLESPNFSTHEVTYEEWQNLRRKGVFDGANLDTLLNNTAVSVANIRYCLAKYAYIDAWNRGDNDMVKFICSFGKMKFIIAPSVREIRDGLNLFTTLGLSTYAVNITREKLINMYWEQRYYYTYVSGFVVMREI